MKHLERTCTLLETSRIENEWFQVHERLVAASLYQKFVVYVKVSKELNVMELARHMPK